MQVEFSVPGRPIGKQRPRFARRGSFITTYTAKETVEYEKKVRTEYNKKNPGVVLEGPISVSIHSVHPIPKGTSKKKTEELIGTPHMKKPDTDNMGKIILDGLNHTAFHDDAQVTEISISKVYGLEPRVDVILKELDPKKKEVTCPLYFFDDNIKEE